jgi:hypothetical protein
MKVIKAIIWASVFGFVAGGLGAGETICAVALILGAIVGYGTEKQDQEEKEQRRVNQLAAQQERQARLIADAIAERDVRQQSGEYN